MESFKLPKELLLGCATAGTQIEGNDYHSNWHHWSQMGRIANGESSLIATDHYNRVEEDLELLQVLGQETYRFSIEWSKIEPREGRWSKKAMDHYINEVNGLIQAGIKPLITLHHFAHPQWFEDKGGWLHSNNIFYYLRFVNLVMKILGDKVSDYVTINEPNVFCGGAYLTGDFPPGITGATHLYLIASKNMIRAHIKAYKLIHRRREAMGHMDTKVGVAFHITKLVTVGENPVTELSRRLMNFYFHDLYLRGMIKGFLSFPLGSNRPRRHKYCEFIGVNYYTRHRVHPSIKPSTLFGDIRLNDQLPDTKVNDLGWEIYPKGLYMTVRKIFKNYRLPIYITENGIADNKDNRRGKFIYEHLAVVKHLIDDGVDIQRYYYWSFLDNLEWQEGYKPRFGLVEVDYETYERKVRQSGWFYRDLINNKGVTDEMIHHYFRE